MNGTGSDFKSTGQKCALQNFRFNETVISSSSGSFVSAFTGNYISVERSSVVPGGSVIQAIDPNGAWIIAKAVEEVQESSIVRSAVRFQVLIERNGQEISVAFSQIDRAQLSTGSMPNSGFTPVGTWPGAQPVSVVDALKRLSDRLNICFNS